MTSAEDGDGGIEAAAARATELALDAGAGASETYGQESRSREIRLYEGAVESLSAATERGIGVRAWIDGRVGYAYGTDLSAAGVRELAAAAVEAAAVSDADEFAALPEADRSSTVPLEGLRDPAIAAWTTERKIELAAAVERAARESDDRVGAVEQTVYVDSADRVASARSDGRSGSYETTSCYAYLQAMAGEPGALQTGLGFGLARGPGGLDPEEIGREAAERAVSLLGATKPATESCPVVIDETVAASFIGLIGSTLGADAVQRGRSPFAGKLEEVIASEALVLSDDGLDPAGFGSAPFDDEGVSRRRTPLIESGRLRTYLHDSYTARREGGSSTGNASRAGYRSPPGVSSSNLVVSAGDAGFERLLELAGDGVYVTDVVGLHSGVNPVSGTFSVGASGRRIAGGELAEPLTGFTIASDLASMLRGVRAVGDAARWVPFGGSVRTPPLLIAEMTVSGE